jgi:hypothetical protein
MNIEGGSYLKEEAMTHLAAIVFFMLVMLMAPLAVRTAFREL